MSLMYAVIDGSNLDLNLVKGQLGGKVGTGSFETVLEEKTGHLCTCDNRYAIYLDT